MPFSESQDVFKIKYILSEQKPRSKGVLPEFMQRSYEISQIFCKQLRFHRSKSKSPFFLQKLINYGDQRGTHTVGPWSTSTKELVLVLENGDTMLCGGSFGRNEHLEFNLQGHGGIKWKGHEHFGKMVFKTWKHLPVLSRN